MSTQLWPEPGDINFSQRFNPLKGVGRTYFYYETSYKDNYCLFKVPSSSSRQPGEDGFEILFKGDIEAFDLS